MAKDRQRLVGGTLIVASLLMLLAVPVTRQTVAGHGDLWQWPSVEASRQSGPWALNRRLQAAIDSFEERLESDSPVQGWSQPWVQYVLSRWGGVGNEQTYLGRDGWLIYRPGFDYLIGNGFLDTEVLTQRRRQAPSWQAPPQPNPLPVLLDFHQQIQQRGIQLLLLPVPSKAMVHPEALNPRTPLGPDLQNPSYDRFVERLQAAGIEVVDAFAVLRELRRNQDAFLRTDSHWNPAAVDAVARYLAALVGPRLSSTTGAWHRFQDQNTGQDTTAPTPSPTGAWHRSQDQNQNTSLSAPWNRHSITIKGRGDLHHLLGMPATEAWQLLAIESVKIQTVGDSDDRLWKADRRSPLLLLGDSFTNVYSDPNLGWGSGAGLAEQLSYHLHAGVDRLAIQDGSATKVRRRLADEQAAGRDRLQGKEVVIYQFAVRELSVGDWQRVELTR